MRILKNQGGFTLIEILATVALISIGFVAILQVFAASDRLASQSRNLTAANNFASGQIDYYRSLGYTAISNGITDVTGSMPSVLTGTARSCSNSLAKWACVLTIKGHITTAFTDAGWDSSIAIGTDGMPVIAAQGNNEVIVRKCEDPACAAGGTYSVAASSPSTPVGNGLSMAIGSDGFPVITYYKNSNGLWVTKCGDSSCSSGNSTSQVIGGVGDGSQPSIAIGSDGLPIISSHGSGTGVKVTKCGGLDCSGGNTTTTILANGTYSSIAVPADGLPVVSMTDGDKLTVAKCQNASCSSFTSAQVSNISGKPPTHTSIDIGANGFPVISFLLTSSSLGVRHCTNASCTTGQDTFDIANTTAQGTSIDVGNDGLPVIAFRESINDDTMIVKCGNVACSSGNKPTIIDSTNASGSGKFVSVSAAAGSPVVSYLNRNDGTLRVAKCAAVDCNAFTASITAIIKYLEGNRSKLLQQTTQVTEDGLGS